MTKSAFQKRIEQIENLPTLPEVANKLIKIINDPTTSAADVAQLIAQDVALTSKVLRLANSAFYGIPRTVTTVHNAVVILGLKVINTMVFSISIVKLFPADGQSALFSRKRFWEHSLACGVIAKQLAMKMKKITLFDPEECFCAGLIHDLGRIVLDQYFHEEFVKALQKAKAEKISLVQAEKDVFEFDHTQVGDWLTARWELPQDIRIPIIHHHLPHKAETNKEMITLVHYADGLAYDMGYCMPDLDRKPEINLPFVQLLGFTPEEVEDVKKMVPEEIKKFQASFDF